MIKRLFMNFFGFELIQYEFGRKWIGGKFYYVDVRGLIMTPFWSYTCITSCQAIILKSEEYK